MSEPARQYPAHDAAGRPAAAPLRDWLAAMKAATAAQHDHPEAHAPRQESARHEPARQETARQETARAPEPSWSPRMAPPPAANARHAEDQDVSDLMAENLMLKAKLSLDADRYASLQGLLADELRSLRSYVEEEMDDFTGVCAERDHYKDLHAALSAELRGARAEVEANGAKMAQVRAERDRAETLRVELLDEARGLRDQVGRETGELARARAEIERAALFHASLSNEVRNLRAQIEKDSGALGDIRAERDLWMSRAEALAQPLFQKR